MCSSMAKRQIVGASIQKESSCLMHTATLHNSSRVPTFLNSQPEQQIKARPTKLGQSCRVLSPALAHIPSTKRTRRSLHTLKAVFSRISSAVTRSDRSQHS